MEIYITLGVLQENNNMLVYVIVHVCVYMDLLVIITNDTFKKHRYPRWHPKFIRKPSDEIHQSKCEWAHNSVIFFGYVGQNQTS